MKFEPLLLPSTSSGQEEEAEEANVVKQTWAESKKIWHVAGPTIFSRLAMFSLTVITQSFAGHLGDRDLAAITLVTTLLIGVTFGFLLGMASALETLCGQAYGAKQYHMLGVYLQRSWIVLSLGAIVMLPLFIFASPIVKFLGQPDDVAELTGKVAIWLIPMHLSFPVQFSFMRFLQCQLKTWVIAWICGGVLVLHVVLSWVFIYILEVGIVGTALILDVSWWTSVLGLVAYSLFGGCPHSWTGFSKQGFLGLWEFFKLSLASGIMLSVRVANELGAGNGKGAKLATKVSLLNSIAIGILFWLIIILFPGKLAMIFTSNTSVIQMVRELAFLLGTTILINCIQPILSGVAVGSGWQALVAYVNLGSYYLVGIPFGLILGWFFHFGLKVGKCIALKTKKKTSRNLFDS
nr:protein DETOXIFICATION 27-like [Ipomoea batatas]